jgi:protein TonB
MNSYLSTDDHKRDILIAWTAALLIHVLFFSLTGKMFIKPPQFSIAPSREIDVNLIGVSSEAKVLIPDTRSSLQFFNSKKIASSLKNAPRNDTNRTMSKEVRLKPFDTNRTMSKEARLKPFDTNRVSSEAIGPLAKPDYVQNPPPPYPALAKQMHQEGIVMLSVDVDREGDPVSVDIIQSSGFRLLDQAALKAVRHWKFQPGRMGDIPVESAVTVPIRFRLEK